MRLRRPKRNTRIWITAAVVLVVAAVVGGIFAARGNGPARAVPAADAKALELAGTDPVTGRRVDLAAYRGKPIVLNVWGSWCEGCRLEARDLARFAAQHPNVQVVGLDLQDTTGGARAFYARYGWYHPSIFDPNGKLAFRLGLQGTPTTFFLDARHRPVAKIVGAASLREFNRGLRVALRSR
jgi:thiol-disulfide isomerase/thioredoxin